MVTYGDAVCNSNIANLVDFHKKQDTIGTVTGVYPPSRFGDLVYEENKVTKFKEKLKDIKTQSPINGGYFVFKREFLELIPDNPSIDLEKKPMDTLTDTNQLSIFKHTGFWHCMDTYRDNQYLNEMWKTNPEWKLWK
jgi:glucose-1-phosphate cytidylyltransferase